MAQYCRITYLSALLRERVCNIALGYIKLNRYPKVVTILFENLLRTIIYLFIYLEKTDILSKYKNNKKNDGINAAYNGRVDIII